MSISEVLTSKYELHFSYSKRLYVIGKSELTNNIIRYFKQNKVVACILLHMCGRRVPNITIFFIYLRHRCFLDELRVWRIQL